MSQKYPKLSEEEVNQLTKLQQLFHNKYLTPQFLHQLISIYVKAIEVFSSEFKGMKSYFMNKMQFVLCQPQINRLLEGEGSINQSIRQTIRLTERTSPSEIIPLEKEIEKKPELDFKKQKKQQDRFQQVYKDRNDHKHQEPKVIHHYHYDENKSNQMGAKIDKKMKFMREYEENMKNAKQQVEQADKKLQKNVQKVKNITKDQQNSLNERLAKRKKKQRRKSIDVKAQVFKMEGQQNTEVAPVVKVQELKEAQRELTTAILKYTIRMTQKQREVERERGAVKGGRVKKARDLEQSEILKEQEQEHEQQEQKEEGRKRIKTTRREIDDD